MGTDFWSRNTVFESIYITVEKKIEDNPSKPEIIITEPGVGYRFVSKK